jgi:hypothetical protein
MTIKNTHLTIELTGDKPGQTRIRRVEVLTREDGSTLEIPMSEIAADFDSPVVKAALGDSHAVIAAELEKERDGASLLAQELAETKEALDVEKAAHATTGSELEAVRAEVVELTAKLPVEEAVTDAPAAE